MREPKSCASLRFTTMIVVVFGALSLASSNGPGLSYSTSPAQEVNFNSLMRLVDSMPSQESEELAFGPRTAWDAARRQDQNAYVQAVSSLPGLVDRLSHEEQVAVENLLGDFTPERGPGIHPDGSCNADCFITSCSITCSGSVACTCAGGFASCVCVEHVPIGAALDEWGIGAMILLLSGAGVFALYRVYAGKILA